MNPILKSFLITLIVIIAIVFYIWALANFPCVVLPIMGVAFIWIIVYLGVNNDDCR